MVHTRLPAAAGLTLMLALGASACSDDGTSSDPECSYETTVAGVSVAGTTGSKPEITVTEESEPATELIVEDLCGPGDAEPVVSGEPTEIVTADYSGVAQSTGVNFDNSYDRGAPLQAQLGQLIRGWQEGMVGMTPGSTRLLIIPGELAYGPAGAPPDIGPNETLIFVVDLVDVEPGTP